MHLMGINNVGLSERTNSLHNIPVLMLWFLEAQTKNRYTQEGRACLRNKKLQKIE